MVPYVRKSFYKHFKDGLKYIEDNTECSISKENAKDISIESQEYKKHEKAWKYALDMTTKETYQAVEGLFHNLNSLQSRSGNQLN